MYRVNGGYILKSFTTNGGEVTLQVHEDITRQEFNTVIYGTPEPEHTGYSPYHGMTVGSYDQRYEGSWAYSVADAVMLQNWLIDSGDLTNSRNSDLCEDKRINSFDFVILRRMIIENKSLSTQ